MRYAAVAIASLALATAGVAQVLPHEVVVAAKNDPGRNLHGGLVAVDRSSGQVNPIRWQLPVIYEFEDVLVESGTGHLFIAGAATGPLSRRVQHWTLAGYGLASSTTIATFRTDIVAMSQEPLGDLWVLTTDPTQLAPNGELWRVDPRGLIAPQLVETWSSADGTPAAIASDESRIFVASHRLRGTARSAAFWDVSPLGGKREIPFLSTSVSSEVLDIDLHRCGEALFVAFATGSNAILDLRTRVLRPHSTLPAGRNRAAQYPTPVLALCAGDGGAASLASVLTWIERGVVRTASLPNFGLVTGLHSDPEYLGYHGQYTGPIPMGYSCAGTNGRTPRIYDVGGPPDLGNASYGLAVDLGFTPTTAMLLLGTQFTYVDLQPLGFPVGCALLELPELILPTMAQTSPHVVSLPIPCDPTIYAALIYAQFFAADPGAGGAGWVSSAQGRITLG